MSTRDLLARLPGLFKPNILWTTALYSEPADFEAGDPLSSEPFYRFDTRRLLRKRTDVLSRGDPFLWVYDDKLYLFMEAEPELGPARVEAWVTTDLDRFTALGEIIREPFHLSYPFPLSVGDRLFLMPESADGNGLFLYQFDPVSGRASRVRQMLEGWFVDSSFVEVDGTWFLFTTTPHGLEIFMTEDPVAGELRRHPSSPVTNDPRISRSGGGVFRTSRGLVRLAQDCSVTYGANLNLVGIEQLSTEGYSERLLREHIYDCNRRWNRLGIHHQSYVRFRGRTIVAIDGRQGDYYVHRLRALLCRAIGR